LVRQLVRAVVGVFLGAEYGVHAAVADYAARQLAEDPADRADREGEQGDQVRDADDVAWLGLAGGYARCAD